MEWDSFLFPYEKLVLKCTMSMLLSVLGAQAASELGAKAMTEKLINDAMNPKGDEDKKVE